MEIVSVETIPVEIPHRSIDQPYGIAPYVGGGAFFDIPEEYSYSEALQAAEKATSSSKKLLIRLETDEGVTGWGETKVPTMAVGETIVKELLAPELLGRSVGDTEGFVEAFTTFASANYIDVTPFLGGAEMAMWDALGKSLGEPVHTLIGGKRRDTYPAAYCLGLHAPEASAEYAKEALDAGFTALKTKGSRYWETDVERIEMMHEAVDGALEFRLDPNQRWSFEDAVRVGAKLESREIHLQYLEQPIRIDSVGTLKRLRERLQTPIAVNEDAYFPRNVYNAVREDAIDAAVVDLVPAGGILGLKRLAAVAGDAGISLAHHSNHDMGIKNAAKLHVLTSTPTFTMPMDATYYALEDDVLAEPLEFEDGEFVVPDRPGLAGAVDADTIEQYRLD